MNTRQSYNVIYEALIRVLRPLVRIMLRSGVTYKAFAEIVKAVYVDIASNEFRIPGRKQTDSRIAVITGLSRKEVSRVSGLKLPQDAPDPVTYNRAARVISGWTQDPDFLDNGEPRMLAFDQGDLNFSDLVRRHSGDAPPRAVLDEMERVKAVVRNEDGTLRLVMQAYVPELDDLEKISLMGGAVGQLILTMDRNFDSDDERDMHFQRIVSNDKLDPAAAAEFNEFAREESRKFLDKLDGWLAEHEASKQRIQMFSGDLQRVGLGLYYFQED
ncbi:MAG TPA: DUF6502 family protein [Gammaproteobacteria bacterium]|nr:DUF6502 family protein [Gammaproteobacteria bacterium]